MAIGRDEQMGSRLKLFNWPILFWMNLIGVPLNLSNGGLVNCNFIFVYSITLFSKGMILTIFSMIKLFTTGSLPSDSSTVKWNVIINQLNEIITTFGTHFVLMSIALVKWKDVVEVLEYFAKSNIFKKEIYNKFNRICWWGLSAAILVNIKQSSFKIDLNCNGIELISF